MIFINNLRIVALAPIVCATLAIAQDSGTNATDPADDEPITVLDQVVPVALAEELVERIAGARLEVVEKAGHQVPLEQPAEVNRLLGRFAEHAT